MEDNIGQYKLPASEKWVIVAGGAASSICLMGLIYQYYVKKTRVLRRHPGEILITRGCCELLWALVFVIVPFIPSEELMRRKPDGSYEANHLTMVLAMVTEWSVLASEIWFLVLGLDLYSSTTNPFSSYKASKTFYSTMAYGFPTLFAAMIFLIRDDNVGVTSFFVPWLVQPCSMREGTTEVEKQCRDAPIDWRKWVFLYVWVVCVEAINLGILFYASHRLQKGIPHTLKERQETLRKSRGFMFSMVAFWIGPAVLVAVDYYINQQGADGSADRHQDFNVAIAVLLSLRGAWSVFTIMTINRRDLGRSASEQVRQQVAEEQSFSPHLNIALRTEILFYATLCTRTAVVTHEVNAIGEKRHSNEGGRPSSRRKGPSETELTDLTKRTAATRELGAFTDNGRAYVYEFTSLGRKELAAHPIARQMLAAQSERTLEERLTMRDTIASTSGLSDLDALDDMRDVAWAAANEDGDADGEPGLQRPSPGLQAHWNAAEAAEAESPDISPSSASATLMSGDPSHHTVHNTLVHGAATRQADIECGDRVSRTARSASDLLADMPGATSPRRPKDCISHFFPDTDLLRFSDYLPSSFVEIRRDICKIDAEEYMESWTSTRDEKFSEGASGAFIFFSRDSKYIVKTCTRREMEVLLSILPDYVKHLRQNPGSRLLNIIGAHCMEIYGQKMYFLVMTNIFPPEADIDERYDLKGSWVNRQSGGKEKPRGRVLKDMDLNYTFMTRADVGGRLAAQIRRDVEFLCGKNLMDYSLLVGVKYARYDVDVDPELTDENDPFVQDSKGGIHAAVVAGPAVFYVGIIDILQTWDLSKQLERWVKMLLKCVDKDGISAIPAIPYMERFMNRAVYANFEGADYAYDQQDHGGIRLSAQAGLRDTAGSFRRTGSTGFPFADVDSRDSDKQSLSRNSKDRWSTGTPRSTSQSTFSMASPTVSGSSGRRSNQQQHSRRATLRSTSLGLDR